MGHPSRLLKIEAAKLWTAFRLALRRMSRLVRYSRGSKIDGERLMNIEGRGFICTKARVLTGEDDWRLLYRGPSGVHRETFLL